MYQSEMSDEEQVETRELVEGVVDEETLIDTVVEEEKHKAKPVKANIKSKQNHKSK